MRAHAAWACHRFISHTALLRLRVPASDATLARALHACAAKAQVDVPAVARLMQREDVEHLRAAADELGWDVPPALLNFW